MKASAPMFLYYLGMIGVPVLLVLLAASTLAPVGPLVRIVLLAVIAAGSLAYGAVALREALVHGRGGEGRAP